MVPGPQGPRRLDSRPSSLSSSSAAGTAVSGRLRLRRPHTNTLASLVGGSQATHSPTRPGTRGVRGPPPPFGPSGSRRPATGSALRGHRPELRRSSALLPARGSPWYRSRSLACSAATCPSAVGQQGPEGRAGTGRGAAEQASAWTASAACPTAAVPWPRAPSGTAGCTAQRRRGQAAGWPAS